MKTAMVFIVFMALMAFQMNVREFSVAQPISRLENSKIAPVISYRLIPLNAEKKAWIKSIRSEDTLAVLKALNRVDVTYLLRQDSILLPSVFTSNLLDYSPFPMNISKIVEVNKLILFYYPIQAFAVYERGTLVRWGPVSMGKQSTPTPLGLYFTNWKAKRAVSTVNKKWIMYWCFNLDNKEGVSMHEFSLPGYPASHACVRLLKEDAFWLYNWADEWRLASAIKIAAYGTPVKISGTYSFGARKPWFSMADQNHLLVVSEAQIESEFRDDIPLILQRQTQRDSVMEIEKRH